MGLPQMIQSRAQFGYRGVIVPLIATLISLVGYNVVATVLVADGAAALWGVNREAVARRPSVLAAALAIWGMTGCIGPSRCCSGSVCRCSRS